MLIYVNGGIMVYRYIYIHTHTHTEWPVYEVHLLANTNNLRLHSANHISATEYI